MVEGSSISKQTADAARRLATDKSSVMVCLDSYHTYEHVREELGLYSPLVTGGSYLVVFDTAIADLPDELFPDRPWGRDNNPRMAVKEFLAGTSRFVVDADIGGKLWLTSNPDGFLKCISDREE